MRSRLLVLGLLPLALAACGGGKSSTPAKSTSTAQQTTAMTIKVTSVVKSTRSHRRFAQVTTAGDRVEFVDDLLNTEPRFGKGANEKIGRDAGTMTFTSRSTARMDGVATLPDGTIVFSGNVTVLPNNSITVPVTGGTGTYKNASGILLVGSGTKTATNTYKLVVGSAGPVA